MTEAAETAESASDVKETETTETKEAQIEKIEKPEDTTAAISEPTPQDAPSTEPPSVVPSQASNDAIKTTTPTEPVTKKRKLSDASHPNDNKKKPAEAPTQTQPQQQPQQQHAFDLEDYSIIPQTVRDLLTLLQLYGALTAGQLEYNLPVNNSPSLIQDVLEVLVCIGLVQKVQEEEETKTPRYCVSRGVPRADPVNLPILQHEIFAAHRQANRCFERTKLLQKAIQDETSNPKDTLQRILQEYPEIQQDPVYITALRQCHVDTSSADRPRKKLSSKLRKSTSSIQKTESNKTPPTTSTVELKPSNPPAPEEIKAAEPKEAKVEPKEAKMEPTTPKPITAVSDGGS